MGGLISTPVCKTPAQTTMPDDQDITYIVTPDAEALLRQAHVDPETLVHRYLDGDLGEPTRIIELMNAQMEGPTGQIGRYKLGDQGVILIRRRRSGMITVMDGASVLTSLGGL